MSRRFSTRWWRDYQEEHVFDGSLLRFAARFPHGPDSVAADARYAPSASTRVSVVIPCYNYARYLPDAVASALEQTGVDVEVIIVDDQSTDESFEVATSLAESDARVRTLRNDVNSGHVRSFNAGWVASTGEYVVKLDADDLLTPGALARAAALFEAHPSVTLVYGHPRHFAGSPPIGRIGNVRWNIWRGGDWLTERCRLGVSAITNPEMVIRSELLRTSGPMDPDVPYAPDMEISLRAAAFGDIGYVAGADQALHREHSDSMSETDGSGTLVDLRARSDAFRRALEKSHNVVDGADRLDALSRRALAADALRFASAIQDRSGSVSSVTSLLEFACQVWPACEGWAQFHRTSVMTPPHGVAKLGGLARRLRRRARDEQYHLRWMVFGV